MNTDSGFVGGFSSRLALAPVASILIPFTLWLEGFLPFNKT